MCLIQFYEWELQLRLVWKITKQTWQQIKCLLFLYQVPPNKNLKAVKSCPHNKYNVNQTIVCWGERQTNCILKTPLLFFYWKRYFEKHPKLLFWCTTRPVTSVGVQYVLCSNFYLRPFLKFSRFNIFIIHLNRCLYYLYLQIKHTNIK